MPYYDGVLVRVSEDTYVVRPPGVGQGRSTRGYVPPEQRDPDKAYCACGRVLRSSNRSGTCSICVAEMRRNRKISQD
jgi:hypothetical protein